jgi:hypothetical protein
MALRIFTDSNGGEWHAFDVVPRADERRRYDRRSPAEQRALEGERRDADRRLTVGGRSPLVNSVSDGWLCFERGIDRRRLSPIPDDWRKCTDQQLEAYCHSARPVHRRAASLERSTEGKR